jgi:hypothetical protein
MAVLRFDPNVAVEVVLKFDSGRQVQSRIHNAPDQMMYTLASGDTMYVPLNVAEQIAKLGVRKGEPFLVTKTVANNVTRWQVERKNAQQAEKLSQSQPAAQPGPKLVATQPEPVSEQPHPSATETIVHTGLSKLMAGCMVAAIDAAATARDYAHAKGLTIALSEQSIQDLATTALIHLQRMAELECKYLEKAAIAMNRVQANGGWRQ